MKTHEEKNLICDGCGKKFSSKIRINLHYRQRHLPAPLAGSIRQKKKPVAIKNTDDTNRTNRVTRIVPRLTKVPPKKKSTKAKP